MRAIQEWMQRLLATLRPGRADSDLEEELRLHLEMAAEEAQRRGANPGEAVRAARIKVGGAAQAMLADVRADGVNGFGINSGPNGRVSYPLWEQIRTHERAFAGTFAWADAGLVVGRGAGARPARGLWVSGGFFRVLGINPERGRLRVDTDDSPGCGARLAVVSHDFWQGPLGGSESVVGSTSTS